MLALVRLWMGEVVQLVDNARRLLQLGRHRIVAIAELSVIPGSHALPSAHSSSQDARR